MAIPTLAKPLASKGYPADFGKVAPAPVRGGQ